MSPDLTFRLREPEIMDRVDLDPEEHRHALEGLARLNSAAMSSRLFLAPLLRLARSTRRPLRVLDVACGAGDSLITIARAASRQGLAIEAFGCDRSEVARRHAEKRAQAAHVVARFHVADVLLDRDPPVAVDVVLNSLFMHHLSEEDAAGFLERMTRWAERAVIVVDLLRTPLGFGLAWTASRLLTRSRIVHFDALASVRAAHSLDEVARLTRRAGLSNAKIERVWPERFRWSWMR